MFFKKLCNLLDMVHRNYHCWLQHIVRAKTFRTRKNFPESNAHALATYFCLCGDGATLEEGQ